ncbi:hypothetical protein Glove_364g86 [Diversispora epigaea]|uniref:Uncharacterized protein n=1 Tax=Diversispora epigaea TaxID=1348612 RepID=A0A397H8K8_9GLOM|nr:hypothetical protein Glove_364g86 [Diversispora epigaea]
MTTLLSSHPSTRIDLEKYLKTFNFLPHYQRDAKYEADITKQDAEIKKLKVDFETKIIKQTKKTPPTVPPKDYEEIHEHYANQGDPKSGFSNEKLLREVTKLFGPPSVQPKLERLRSSNQANEIRSLRNEIIEIRNAENQSRDVLNQMYNRYKNLTNDDYTSKVKSNRTGFVPLEPIFNNDDKNGYNNDDDIFYDSKKNGYQQ